MCSLKSVRWISPRHKNSYFQEFVLLWMLKETMAACSHAFSAWPWPVLSRISVAHRVVAGLCCQFEINVNLRLLH